MQTKTRLALASLGLLTLGGCGQSAAATSSSLSITAQTKRPQGAYSTKQYRNVFTEWDIATDDQVKAKLDTYWNSMFASTDDNKRLYYPFDNDKSTSAIDGNENGPLAYIADIGNGDVRSEGISYGMMIAVQMNKKAEFDALWNFAKSKMQHQEGPRQGYFAWQTSFDGTIKDPNPASDGEAYFATALFFASHRWGDGAGIYHYSREANDILNTMLHKEDMNGGVVDGVTNMFSREHKQIVFVPHYDNADFTDPSYHLPAFFELWARWAQGYQGQQREDRKFWQQAAQASRDFFERTTHPETGLMPDYANFDGTPKGPSWNPGAVNFRFDAWRTAVNWSVDQVWWGQGNRGKNLTDKLQAFFAAKKDANEYVSQYTLDGRPLVTYLSSGLIASNGAASIATDGPLAKRFATELWNLNPPTGKWRYYDGLLNFMALLHASGEFKIH